MINSVSNSFINNAAVLNENNLPGDRQAAIDMPKEVTNKIDGKDLTIKDQIKSLADNGPPIDKMVVQEIKVKVEQGRYPIDLDMVTEKMFENFKQAAN
jgi:anti-sigma28 factor (negative regulator of flagellin synthesis)|tara:strand:+ start:431 stop:724 length:294 start_codon:yes stop_codon:yes gene_type:complete